ncbi:ergothioneine biosynthesis glutamate--cysteine ligase EgtA [Intrasporangium mesophilum]
MASHALAGSPIGRVGLELEFHVVDLAHPQRRVAWSRLTELRSGLPSPPGGSRVTIEPGGQFELSTPPMADVATAIAALRIDEHVLATAAASAGLGLVSIGADPARAVQRVNPGARYVAMERHFDSLGYGVAGRAMMSSTAALQVNVDAGLPDSWATRLRRLHSLGPVLLALSACSPVLAGRATGWRSMRQQVWRDLDPRRCGPMAVGPDPAQAWAAYALAAPVMMVRDPVAASASPLTRPVPFADWVTGAVPLSRRPTFEDLDYHLSTLFPPLRPRGFLEIRCMDAVPRRWWPALAAVAVTLLDDDRAADLADDACAPVVGRWMPAARDGLADPRVGPAARRCMEIAAERCTEALRPEVEAYAEMVCRGRTPGDDLREQAALRGPLAVLEEEARA